LNVRRRRGKTGRGPRYAAVPISLDRTSLTPSQKERKEKRRRDLEHQKKEREALELKEKLDVCRTPSSSD